MYNSKLNTLDVDDFFFLLLTEWVFGKRSLIKQDRDGHFLLRNGFTKKDTYHLLDQILLFNILSEERCIYETDENPIFMLKEN